MITEAKEKLLSIVDQGRLAAVLHYPSTNGDRVRAVIICQGLNGERAEKHRMAVKFGRLLAANGIACMRFDYFGMGLSDGASYEMTTSTKVSNVKKVYAYLRALGFIHPDKITLLGFSDGAKISLLSALELEVRSLIHWSPVYKGGARNYFAARKPKVIRNPHDGNSFVVPWSGLWFGVRYFQDLANHDVAAGLKAYSGKSLVIYDNQDDTVRTDLESLQPDCDFAFNRQRDVLRVDGAGHLFSSAEFERKVMLASLHWLQRAV
ncbi:serine aminopeptidase domain-containing protein [Cohnella soli]|uniref:Serine aminopeptidase domain-containing protein n=1 Tax=Cohnella soli TaxID=425005 RepID=A0ABW0I207_9BACL